jgi:hypothetical protein
MSGEVHLHADAYNERPFSGITLAVPAKEIPQSGFCDVEIFFAAFLDFIVDTGFLSQLGNYLKFNICKTEKRRRR